MKFILWCQVLVGFLSLFLIAQFALADIHVCNNENFKSIFQSITAGPPHEPCHFYKLNYRALGIKILQFVVIKNSYIQQSDFRGVDLTSSILTNTKFELVDLREANLENAILYQSIVSQSDLRGANLKNADLRNITGYETSYFAGANFTNALVSPDFAEYLQKRGIEGFVIYVEDEESKASASNAGEENTELAQMANHTEVGTVAHAGSEKHDHWIFSVPFQRIEAGSFTMGLPVSEQNQHAPKILEQKRVQISGSYEIMKTEVTQLQWFMVMGNKPSEFKSQQYCDNYKDNMCPNHPVERVYWNEVQEFIRRLNGELGLKGCYGTPKSASGCYRLPTEAEWEYAARGGTTTTYFFGNSRKLGEYAWYGSNSFGQTHEVCLKKSNPFGLCDVYGNVWEWVADIYDDDSLTGGVDPLNTIGGLNARVIRGGSLDDESSHSALRTYSYGYPLSRSNKIGFRLVRTL